MLLALTACGDRKVGRAGGSTRANRNPDGHHLAGRNDPARDDARGRQGRRHLDDRELAQRRPADLAGQDHPGVREAANPRHQGGVLADRADRIQRGAQFAKLDAGTAGDLITCRPFDASLAAVQEGPPRAGHRPSRAWRISARSRARAGAPTTARPPSASRWPRSSTASSTTRTRSTSSASACRRPRTSSSPPSDKIKADGTYVPLALGTKDQWEAATMGYQNIGPNYWHGEDGRLALIAGKEKLTDAGMGRAVPGAEARWAAYMGDGYQAQAYPDSQNLFALGRAAIYPAGSWDISLFNQQAEFKMGAFYPPVKKAGDTCYISDHVDIALGMNAKSKHIRTRGQEVPGVGRFAGLRHHLREFACRASSACPNQPVTLGGSDRHRVRRTGARTARPRSGRPTRCCRAARPTSRTRPGPPRRT